MSDPIKDRAGGPATTPPATLDEGRAGTPVRESLSRCRACDEPVAASATSCPHCGAQTPAQSSPPRRPRRPPWVDHWLVDLVLKPLIIGGVLTLLLSALFSACAQPRIEDWLAPPDCQDPKDLEKIAVAGASATSERANEEVPVPELGTDENGQVKTREFDYRPENLVDGDTGTAWSEGDTEGNQLGHGESATLQFDEPVDIDLLCVVNGFAYAEDLYRKNARVRELTIDAGSKSRRVTLEDVGVDGGVVFQPVSLNFGRVQSLTLTIDTTYAGLGDTRASDTLLSEVELWGQPAGN